MRSRRQLLLPVLLTVLLVLLAGLQWRWISQIARGEEARLRAVMEHGGQRLAIDLDRELRRLQNLFTVEPRLRERVRRQDRRSEALPLELIERAFGSALDRWNQEALDAEVLDRAVLVVGTRGEFKLLEFKFNTGKFVSCGDQKLTTNLLDFFREDRSRPNRRGPMDARPYRMPQTPMLEDPLALLAWNGRSGVMRIDYEGNTYGAFPVLLLDQEHIAERTIPRLAEDYLLSGPQSAAPFELAVINHEDQSVLFSSIGEMLDPVDQSLPLLRLGSPGLGSGRNRIDPFTPPPLETGAWTLQIRHRAGSLQTAIRNHLLRNAGVSLGILSLLGATLYLMLQSARRREVLASQQLEFVSGITHELNTPLAAVRSAGQNLADGLVAQERTKTYGELIVREGERLSSLVSQALDFAGMQSGTSPYEPRPTTVNPIVESAVEACEWLQKDYPTQVELDLTEGLPEASVDPDALNRMVQNLVANAMRYGRNSNSDAPARVFVRTERGERGVNIIVSDEGPGIAQRERGRIFEPFVRGDAAKQGPVPGSGLGLSIVKHLVERQGGRVETLPAKHGASFRLQLAEAYD